MGKKLQKYLDEAEKTEQQIAELEERLRTIRAAQKKEEDSEIIRAIRSTKMGGRELLALLDNIQAGNVTFLTAVNNASEEAETEEAIEKDKSYDGRFSHSNKEWAEQVSTPEHNADRMTFRTDWVVDSHPAILDGFVTMFRKELEAQKEQEQPFVKQFYVVENTALENELAQTVANIESTHPGYDEYRYSVDEIGHNPYELASYLSAKYHVYFREQVQDELREIFEAQYELTLTEEVEIRYRTETSTDPETGETTTEEVPYEYYILNVTLTNKTLPAVILPRLNEQQREIYTVMQQLKGNKPYLWEGIYNGGEDTGPSYEIPGEALDDPAFAALMEEATKYIGWPYVWGGSSPSTSFDCSGFVCWVYTASGVHNLPRTTAQGIYNQCAIISPSEAKPGDIIFFTGTYDSPGPVSHVGIYVGDGMMLHCGSPIQYANINSSYWQTHFYAFGRL